LAEKPSVASDIARVLNCNTKGHGFFESDKFIVTWALGHLVTLADPDEYDKKYEKWNLEDLPMLPAKMKLIIIKQTSGQYNSVKSQLVRSDVDGIIIATDAGREGELVARWIIEKANVKKPIKRLWISSVTDKAIKEGFEKLKDGREYESLYASAQARAQADWIVGINATRALTCKFGAQLSCGRVQTPTLAMIAQREREIQSFIPKAFYGATTIANSIKFVWCKEPSGEVRNFDKAAMEAIIKSIATKNILIKEINKTIKKVNAPQLYNLTELQRDANKQFDYTAKETLGYMQNLYEKHKVLTYPRTDSRHLSNDITDTLKDRVKACGVGPYSQLIGEIIRKPISVNKNFVDDTKISDHHAIIPTEQTVFLNEMASGERKIYDLVVKRFLSVFYPPFEYEQTNVKALIGSETFIASGKIVKNIGWKAVYGNNIDTDDDSNEQTDGQTLPPIEKGQSFNVTSLKLTEGRTTPPKPFNEASLLSAMESPIKYMQGASQELIKTMGETSGLGTVATRADVIEKLFSTFLLEKRGKDIFTTSKGLQLLTLVPTDMKSPILTAKWEQKLSLIAKNSLKNTAFIDDMRLYTEQIVREIKNSVSQYKHENVTMEHCPECGKYLLAVNGKKGKMLVCQDRDCGYRKGVSMITNARCQVCHKKLELRGEGEGKLFVCSCGYREKLSSFNNRKVETVGASKAETAKLISQINNNNNNKTSNEDNPFAAALKMFDKK